MSDQREIDAMAEACIEAGRLVMRSGSPTLQAAMRDLLYRLGRDLARREEPKAVARRRNAAKNGASGG